MLNNFLLAAVLITSMQLLLIPKASALEIDCEVPLAVVCQVSDPDGFMSVSVNVDFGDLGYIDVATQSFPICRTEATISWDPIVPNFEITTTPCSGGKSKLTFEPGVDDGKHLYDFVSAQLNSIRRESILPTKKLPEFKYEVAKIYKDRIFTSGAVVIAEAKFCGDDMVDDDITDCDIDEIAYACPDGQTPSSGECEEYSDGSFPSD